MELNIPGKQSQALTQNIWALIPAHNEGRHIQEVVRRASHFVAQVWVIADHCTDDTAEQARAAGAQVLELASSHGKGWALRQGWNHLLQFPQWTHLVLLDGDGQHNPQEIAFFVLEQQRSSADVIIGNRMLQRSNMPLLRRWCNLGMTRILSCFGSSKISDSQCGFRLLTRHFVENHSWKSRNFEIESEMVVHALRNNYKISQVLVSTIYQNEKSSIHPFRDGLRWISFLFESWPFKSL